MELARLLSTLPAAVLDDLERSDATKESDPQLGRLLQTLTDEDRQRIIELRGQLGSRSAVLQEFWKTNRKPSGPHYQVIRVVLDEAGLP